VDSSNAYYCTSKLDADHVSFQVVDKYYAKDNSNVFFLGNKIIGARSSSFQVLGDSYAKDSNNAYYFGQIIPGADVASFVWIGQGFAKDENHVYLFGAITTVPPPATSKSQGVRMSL
jgi:hypothetical protein